MKHIIKKIEYITGDIRRCEKANIVTENIEAERNRLYAEVSCDVIYFTYETILEGGKQ